MTGLYLPGAKWRPISYRADAGKFTHPPLGYIVHVPVSNGSLFNYFNGLVSPARKFCTAFIFKDGSSEQYTTLDMKAWAQGDGNGDYWSFEVEGFPSEPMTDAQLDTLATWHRFLGVEDRIATAPGQRGIGTHQMGGAAWGGHSCPGAIRTAQLPQILNRLQEDIVTPDDIKAIADEVLTRPVKDIAGNELPLGKALGITYRNTQLIASLEKASADTVAAAVVAALPDGHTATADEIAKSLLIQLAQQKETTP